MTSQHFHTFKATRITQVSLTAYPNGHPLRNFRGDQSRLLLHTNIDFGVRSVIGRALLITLKRDAIEWIITTLLRTPFWRARIQVMLKEALHLADQPRATYLDLEASIREELDKLDFGHALCYQPSCKHTHHPTRDPKNNVREYERV